MVAGARANPDGYTITVVGPSFVVNTSLFDKVRRCDESHGRARRSKRVQVPDRIALHFCNGTESFGIANRNRGGFSGAETVWFDRV
jgi:hypothetical protein